MTVTMECQSEGKFLRQGLKMPQMLAQAHSKFFDFDQNLVEFI